jgi:cobaltochelatase CobT
MQNQPLAGTLPILVRLLGEDAGLDVEIGGNSAYIDWPTNTIHYPDLPYNDPEVEVKAYGYSYHEVGHKLFTNPEHKVGIDTELHRSVYQSIEDVRIEKRAWNRFFTAKQRLEEMGNVLITEGSFRGANQNDHPGMVLTSYILHKLRFEITEMQEFGCLVKQSESAMQAVFPSGLLTKLDALLAKTHSLVDTAGSVELSREIVEFLSEEAETDSDDDPDNTDAQGDPDDGDDTSTDQPTPCDDTDGSTPGQQENKGPGKDSSDTVKQKAIKQALDAESGELVNDAGDVMAKALENAAANSTGGANKAIQIGKLDNGTVFMNSDSSIIHEVTAEMNALRKRFRSALQTHRKVKTRHSQTGNRIANKRLYQASMGGRLFQTQRKKKALNTVIQVLLDRSTSMREDGRIEVAKKTALTVGLSLDEIQGIRCACAAFEGRENEVIPLTRFNEKFRETAGYYASLTAQHYTPMAEAIYWGYAELLSQPEPRKILLVVTDGMPYKRVSEPDYTGKTKRLITMGEQSGIEVYGLGINTDAVYGLFSQAVSIEEIHELPTAMFTLLQNVLFNAA